MQSTLLNMLTAIEGVLRGPADVASNGEPESQEIAAIIELAAGAELFHNANLECFVTAEIDGVRQTWRVNSEECRSWLRLCNYRKEKRRCRRSAPGCRRRTCVPGLVRWSATGGFPARR